MFAGKGGRESRRERTFVGSECAACEEPLEHTLRGEHILQLSCGHVSHEACFYEYIKEFEAQNCPTCNAPLGIDTSRGGGIDFENLNKLVRQAQSPDIRDRYRDAQATPTPWETETLRQPSQPSIQQSSRGPPRSSRDHLLPPQSRTNGYQTNGYHYDKAHGRNESSDTQGAVSATEYASTHHTSGRRHDYDVQSMETSLSNPRHMARSPIPPPMVTVRSEFPTLSKSRQQQSLTCLVTVEVVDGKWQPNPEDFRSPPPVPATIPEEEYEQPKPKAKPRPAPQPQRPVDSVHEDLQGLEEVKEDLYRRCENWHGLDFQRFGRLILFGNVRVGKDKQAWQELECYLFTEMLICVKAKKIGPTASQQWDGPEGPTKKAARVTLKGSILIKKHLKQVEVIPGKCELLGRHEIRTNKIQNTRSSHSAYPWPSSHIFIYNFTSDRSSRSGEERFSTSIGQSHLHLSLNKPNSTKTTLEQTRRSMQQINLKVVRECLPYILHRTAPTVRKSLHLQSTPTLELAPTSRDCPWQRSTSRSMLSS